MLILPTHPRFAWERLVCFGRYKREMIDSLKVAKTEVLRTEGEDLRMHFETMREHTENGQLEGRLLGKTFGPRPARRLREGKERSKEGARESHVAWWGERGEGSRPLTLSVQSKDRREPP